MEEKPPEEENNQEMDESEFDYGGGELVFNGIIRTDIKKDEPEELRNQVLSKLPEFERGSPAQEGSGRIEVDLEEEAEEAELPSQLRSMASNLITLEYRYEKYDDSPIEVVEYEDGEPKHSEAIPRRTHSVFLYWDYPDTIFMQGARTRVNDVAPRINSSLGKDVEFKYSEFDEEFLLWLVLKYRHSEDLDSRIGIEKLSSSELTGGDPADFGEDAEIEETDDVSQSIPILAGILKDMDFSMLEGIFTINGYRVNSKIYSDGRARLYANRALHDASKLERALISNLYLSELMKEYQRWRDLPKTDKYPHPRYFKQLHDEANDHGANYDFDFTALVHRYAELRDENPSTYDFEFEIYEPEGEND